MTEWKQLRQRRGKADSMPFTSRYDRITWEALQRVADQEEQNVSAVIYTAVLRLPEVRTEIANIKREKRGEQSTAVGRPGHR